MSFLKSAMKLQQNYKPTTFVQRLGGNSHKPFLLLKINFRFIERKIGNIIKSWKML